MSNNNKIVYLTKERVIEFEKELRELKTKGRADMARRIADARSYGDLSENSEYDAAKEAQVHLENRIDKLEQTLSHSRIIESRELPNDKIYILSIVKLLNKKTAQEVVYTLVSPEEANFENNKISITSPIGKGLMGKKEGDEVLIKVPAGSFEFKILEVNR